MYNSFFETYAHIDWLFKSAHINIAISHTAECGYLPDRLRLLHNHGEMLDAVL